jgi:DNA-binding MarR family transcriptional regulator
MTTTEAADSVAMIEEALVTIVREVGRPRLQEQLAREAGVAVERAGYNLLRLLDEQGSVPITGLARGLGLDNSTVSRQVHALERGGMVSRFRGPTDRRVMGIALTEAGREALERLRAVRHRACAEMLAGWTTAEVRMLAPLLQRLADEFIAYGGTR